jgi:carboxyl-terminal processing protease
LKNRLAIYLPVLLSLTLIAGIFLGHRLIPLTSHSPIFQLNLSRYDKMNDVLNFIEKEYVDSVNRADIMEKGILGILNQLDPHSQYIRAEDFNEMNDPLTGSFEGIGIQFQIEQDTISVIHAIPGGPSEKAGILAGDRIVKVNDTMVAGVGIDNRGAMQKLKGTRGSKVKVSVYRRDLKEIHDFIIIRDVIPTYSIDIAYLPVEEIGYVKLNRFSATTYNEFEEVILKLSGQGMTGLILDLRGNAGGYLQAAIDIADEFLEKGTLIVFTEGRNEPRESFYASGKGRLINTELIVLIDEGSASASEILAGAIQDNDRGTILGRRSFGKGLVQRQLGLADGSALRLTVARYYTPTGRSIQKPFKKENGFEEYYGSAHSEPQDSHDSLFVDDTIQFLTRGGKVVTGGGGILPDSIVPSVEDNQSPLFNSLLRRGLMYRFAFEYTDKNRKKLQSYSEFETFNKQFKITPVILNEFEDFLIQQGIETGNNDFQSSSNQIETMLKAYIGRNIFDNAGFYPIYLKIDPVFNAAINLLNISKEDQLTNYKPH